MRSISKIAVLFLILDFAASSTLVLTLAAAQSIYIPAIPTFTVAFVNSTYNVPTTYSTDPYSGATITHPDYVVDNSSIQLSIKNQQQFTPYQSNGQIINFFYNVRVKGHYAESWTNLFLLSDGLPAQSNSDYTVLAFPQRSDGSFTSISCFFGASYGEIDFQVEALIGSIHRDASLAMAPWVFDGQESGWSSTQTFIVSGNTVIPTASAFESTPNPTVSVVPQIAQRQTQLNQTLRLR